MARFQSDLTRIAMQAPEAAQEALLQTGADVVDILKQPGWTPRDTGNLQDSYGALPVDSSTVHVGTDVEYAPHVEFGTVDQAAQPHLLPAMVQAEAAFKVRLKEAAEKRLTR